MYRDNPEASVIAKTTYVDTKCPYCNRSIVIIKGHKYNRYGNKWRIGDDHKCGHDG